MPLRILDRTTFAPTNSRLPLAEYFDPTKNTDYYIRCQGDAVNGLVSLSTISTICKSLSDEESFDEAAPIILQQYSNDGNGTWTTLFKEIYKLFPENDRWILFFSGLTMDSWITNSVVKVKFYTFINITNGYNEFHRDHYSFNFNATYRDNEYSLTEAQKTAFINGLASRNIIQNVTERNFSTPQKVNHADSNLPRLPAIIFRYYSNLVVFYPAGDYRSFNVAHDWTTTKSIAGYISAGLKFNMKVNTGNQIRFSVIPNTANRDFFERIFGHNQNILEYLPIKIKGPKEPSAILYGVELEANGAYTPKEIIAAQKDLFFLMKADSTIRGSHANNYELVTVPASLKAHKRLWAEFFERVDYEKFDTSKQTGNGMHVHIGRECFSKSHLNKFTWFITNPSNFDFIYCISERPTTQNLREWAPLPTYGHPTKILGSKSARNVNSGLRGAVHYKGNKTVEVRLFKGIVSYATIIKNLEFVDSVYEYTRLHELSQIGLSHYLKWLNDTPKNKYTLLKAFLNEIKAEEFAITAFLNDYLWSASSEEQIAAKLNKAPFKVTASHLNILNKKRRKKAFILKDGIVITSFRSGGLLAKLDKATQQKQTRGSVTLSVSDFAA
jgi:hypothetical protein